MLILFFVLAIILMLGFFRLTIDFLSHFFGLAAIVILIIFVFLTFKVATSKNIINDKIARYQEENAAIEQNIDRIVEEYQKQNPDISASPEADSITLIALIPELQSNEFIQKQLYIYYNNNCHIDELRDKKISLTKLKWLLYFGK